MKKIFKNFLRSHWGWSGGAKVLSKLPVPGRPTNLDSSRAWACYACSGCGWGLFGHFFLSSIIFLFFLPFSARYRLKYCLKGPLNPNQPTNQPNLRSHLAQMVETWYVALPCGLLPFFSLPEPKAPGELIV